MIKRLQAIRKRGFNLIEAAIVLAVVGAVIGGIWTAASSMIETYKVNKTIEGILTIASNVQGTLSKKDSMNLSHGENITNLIISTNGIPENWIINGSAKNLFGGNTVIENGNSSSDPRGAIKILGVPKSSCINISSKLSAIAENSRSSNHITSSNFFRTIQVNGIWYDGSDFPITPEIATTSCNLVSNEILVSFNLPRNN